jgi:hypothetical protein
MMYVYRNEDATTAIPPNDFHGQYRDKPILHDYIKEILVF